MATPSYIVYGSILSGGGLSGLATYIYDESDNLLWRGETSSSTTTFFSNPQPQGTTTADAPNGWVDTVGKVSGSPNNTILSQYSTATVTIDRAKNLGVFTINDVSYFFPLDNMEVTGTNWFYYNAGNTGKGGSSTAVYEILTLGISPPPKPDITSVVYNNGVATVYYSFINGVADGSVFSYGDIADSYNGDTWSSDQNRYTKTELIRNASYSEATVVSGNTYYYRVGAQRQEVINGETYYSTIVYSDVYSAAYQEDPVMAYPEIPVKSYLNLERNPASDYHAATKKYVDDLIAGESSGLVPTKNETGYVFLSNATSGSAGTWTAYATSVTSGGTGLVTSGAVYTAISNLSTVYSAVGHTHAAGDVTSGTFDAARIQTATSGAVGGVKIGDGLAINATSSVASVDVGNGLAINATSKKVEVKLASTSYLSVSSSGLSIDTTNLKTGLGLGTAAYVNTGTAAGDVPLLQGTSGTLDSARLPKANGSAAYGIVALASSNSGLNLNTGVLSVQAGNGIQVGSGGVAIKLASGSYLSVSSSGLSVNTTALAVGLGLGTAASADTGTAEGNVPVLGSNGKLNTSVLPALAITDTFVKSSQADMLAITGADIGDVCVRTDINKSFILKEDGASTLSHWQELLTPTDAVTSVNGQTGTVSITLSSLGGLPSSYLETTLTANSDVKVPSSKAVATYVSNNAIPSSYLETTLTASSDVKVASSKAVATYVSGYAAPLSHNHNASDINAGTLASERIPTAGASSKGGVTVNGNGLKIITGTSTIAVDFLAASGGVYDTTDTTKPVNAAAVKAIADASAASAAKGYAGTVTGDGSTVNFDVTHNLGTTNVIVQVYDPTGVPCLIAFTRATNKITLQFAAAPANNSSYSVMIIAIS